MRTNFVDSFAMSLVFALAGCSSTAPTPELRFSGNHAISDQELAAAVGAPPETGPSTESWTERTELLVLAEYYDHGYIDARVERAPANSPEVIALQIEEGPRYRLASIRVLERDAHGREAVPLEDAASLRSRLGVLDGEWFNRGALVEGLERIRTLYRSAGFAAVTADPEVDRDAHAQAVSVVVPIVRGSRLGSE